VKLAAAGLVVTVERCGRALAVEDADYEKVEGSPPQDAWSTADLVLVQPPSSTRRVA
jgi:hypothetical protein